MSCPCLLLGCNRYSPGTNTVGDGLQQQSSGPAIVSGTAAFRCRESQRLHTTEKLADGRGLIVRGIGHNLFKERERLEIMADEPDGEAGRISSHDETCQSDARVSFSEEQLEFNQVIERHVQRCLDKNIVQAEVLDLAFLHALILPRNEYPSPKNHPPPVSSFHVSPLPMCS